MIKTFIDHLFSVRINSSAIKFNYTFYLGICLMATTVLLFLSGFLLAFYYFPLPDLAYNSLLFIEENVFMGRFLRSFHRMLTHFFLILSAMHILRVIFSGIYKKRKFNYKLGYITFLLIIFYAYTGYLMPFDQLSFWATTTGMELIKQLPAGDKIVNLIVPFAVEDRYTLLRFYALHVVVLPVILTFLLGIHMYVLRKDKLYLQNPTKISLDNYKTFIFKVVTLFFILTLGCSILIKAPLGAPADFVTPPNPAKSAWFLLWIQEIVSIRGYLFNVVSAIFVAYFFLPDLSKPAEECRWFSKNDMLVWGFTLLLSLFIILLTVLAYYFRGENWSFVF